MKIGRVGADARFDNRRLRSLDQLCLIEIAGPRSNLSRNLPFAEFFSFAQTRVRERELARRKKIRRSCATRAPISHSPNFFPPPKPPFASASRTRSSPTPRSFAASATQFGARYSGWIGSYQSLLSMNGERTIIPLRR